MPSSFALPDRHRAVLATIADLLLPATEQMPAPSAVSLEGKWVDRVLDARPDLFEPLIAALESVGGEKPIQLERLAANQPQAVEVLLYVLSAAYYVHPKVRRRLQYPGQQADVPRADEAEHDLRGGLLDPVLSRGPIFRDPDGARLAAEFPYPVPPPA